MKSGVEGETHQSPSWSSPDGIDLEPRHPQVVRISRRTSVALIMLVVVLLGLFAYGGWKRRQKQEEAAAESGTPKRAAPASSAAAEIERDVPAGNMSAVRPAPPALAHPGELTAPEDLQTPSVGGRGVPAASYPPQGAPPYAYAPNQVQQPKEPTPEEKRIQAAYDAEQRAIAAATATGGISNAATVAVSASRSVPAEYRPNAQGTESQSEPEGPEPGDTKLGFLNKARSNTSENYLGATRRQPLSDLEIKAGWEIPAVMEQALNSDLPGELKALVASNVYDTSSGRNVLIPQGARLVGEYNSQLGYGQDGVQVVWNRVIYPDGSSLDLKGMIGQDMAGFSGFRDKIDHHYKRLVGFAVLTSLFSAASGIAQNRNRSVLTYPNPGEVAASSIGQQVSELGSQITRKNLGVQPTVKILAGYRFNVRVNRDILFEEAYRSAN